MPGSLRVGCENSETQYELRRSQSKGKDSMQTEIYGSSESMPQGRACQCGRERFCSERQDRLEKNDKDKWSWLTRLIIRQPREWGLPLCFGFYMHYLSSSTHVQVGFRSFRINLSFLQVGKVRQQETKLLVHSYSSVKRGLLRHLTHGLWVRIKVCSSLSQTGFGRGESNVFCSSNVMLAVHVTVD